MFIILHFGTGPATEMMFRSRTRGKVTTPGGGAAAHPSVVVRGQVRVVV